MANLYRLNFKGDGTQHRALNSLKFQAASDADAATVAAAIDGAMAAALVATMRVDLQQDTGGTHPEGSRTSVKAYFKDASGVPLKLNWRNQDPGKTVAEIKGVFVGNCGVPGGGVVTLGSVTVNDLPGAPA